MGRPMFESLEAFGAAVGGSAFADALKFSLYGYSLTNTAHIFGVALLVGAILPLDLRLLGFFRSVDREQATRLLVPFAATGLAIAVCAGMALFTARAGNYVQSSLFGYKLFLISAGALGAIILHMRAGWWLEGASDRCVTVHGALSLISWLGALVLGRMIAYFPG